MAPQPSSMGGCQRGLRSEWVSSCRPHGNIWNWPEGTHSTCGCPMMVLVEDEDIIFTNVSCMIQCSCLKFKLTIHQYSQWLLPASYSYHTNRICVCLSSSLSLSLPNRSRQMAAHLESGSALRFSWPLLPSVCLWGNVGCNSRLTLKECDSRTTHVKSHDILLWIASI